MSVERVHHALSVLEEVVGRPVWVLAARWQDDHAVNLDEEAWWRVEDLLISAPDEIAVVLWGRGGQVGFANRWHRAFRAHNVRAYAAGVLTGAFTLTALSAQEVCFWPGAGLGSHETGLLGPSAPVFAVDAIDRVPPGFALDDPELRRPALSIANKRREREIATHALSLIVEGDAFQDALRVGALGDELALGAPELVALGKEARQVQGEERIALGHLRQEIAEYLGLRARPAPRFTDLALGEEVEFELAVDEPGALLMSRSQGFELVLDTGSPDPDTNLFQGEWRSLLLP